MATLQLYTDTDIDLDLRLTVEIKGEEEYVDLSMSHSIDDDVEVDLSDRDILDALEEESTDLDFLFEWMQDDQCVAECVRYCLNPTNARSNDTAATQVYQALFEERTKEFFDHVFGKTEGEYNNPVSDQTDVLDDLLSKLGPEAKAYLAEQTNPVEA
jgi:hypothetical protein